MHAGLRRLLDLIKVNPNDGLLVDRFLVLVADLVEDDRATLTLELARVILRKNPRKSIELAHMVFKHKPEETKPLELMIEGLEILGRYGKATVLRQQMLKVKNLDSASKSSQQNVSDVERADTLTQSVAVIDRELLQWGYAPPQSKNPRTPEIIPVVKPPEQVPNSGSNSTPKLPLPNETMLDQVIVPSSSSGDDQSFRPPLGVPDFNKLSPKVLHLPRELQDGLGEASKGQMDFQIANGESSEAEKITEVSERAFITKADVLKKLKDFYERAEWDSAFSLMTQDLSQELASSVAREVMAIGFGEVEVRFKIWHLERLQYSKQHRLTLIKAREYLEAEPEIYLAKKIWPIIKLSFSQLGFPVGLLGWKEQQGVRSLLVRLTNKQMNLSASCLIA